MSGLHTAGKVRVGARATEVVSDVQGPGVPGSDHESYGGFLVAESVAPENARRLVACWNACDGIATEVLEAKPFGDAMIDSTLITGMVPDAKGGMTIGLEGGACGLLASSFAEQFTGVGATNFLEVQMGTPELGEFTVTMQRLQGKTPGALHGEVVQQRDRLRAALERLATTPGHLPERTEALSAALDLLQEMKP